MNMDSSESQDENSKEHKDFLPEKKIEFEDEAHSKKYIMWENKSNICWLDSSMALVANNRAMKKYSHVSPECYINKIILAYDDAINIINGSEYTMEEKLNLARERLTYIQKKTLNFLQPILKYKTGDPESAFCSLYNLLIQDPVVKKIFEITWLSVKECTNCGQNSEIIKTKPIITVSKIHSFDPENLSVIFRCNCNKSEQKMKLLYVSLPPCMIFHFENGAGNKKPPLSFTTERREYHLTGIMTLEKSQDSKVNHFITWVRDPSVDKWLDCNDLNSDVIYFSPDSPDINIKDVYMYVYEAFDDFGTITDSKIIKDKKSEENIPCFNLSDNSDSEICDSQISAAESNKDVGENKLLKPQLKSSNVKLDRNASLDKKQTTDKSAVEKSTEKINENSCLVPGFKDDFLTPDNRPNDFVTKDSTSAENKPSFKNKKKKNSKNTSKNIKNNEVLSRVVSPDTSQTTITKNLKRLKIKDLIQLNCGDKTNVKKDYVNNSEQRDDKPTLNSSEQEGKISALFLRDAGASSSGTSYVKLIRQKNAPCDLLNKTNCEIDPANPDLSEALDNTDDAIPSTSTSLKRERVADDADDIPSEKSKKKLSKWGKDSVSSGKKTQENLQSTRKKSHVKSKLNNTSKRTVGNNSGSNDSPRSPSGPSLTAGAAENSNVNSANDVTILKDFADVLSCHEPGCNCQSADDDEIIDKSVDFVLAYFSKLSQEFEKFSK